MNNKKLLSKITFAFCVSIFFQTYVNGQGEMILPVQNNNVIKAEIAKQKGNYYEYRSNAIGPDTLFLPFFDDFSKASVWPAAERWIDSSTFVNYNFPINPPTIGTVTFDGLDFEGNPYNNTNANANGLSDELTSKPINLLNDNNGLPYNAPIVSFWFFIFKGRGEVIILKVMIHLLSSF
ncbi:MAG: hypothetical protein IPP71_21690 [Bacteroidetes bacterium]|nr:hypothetical protein [Bacteroidota bacterium]